MYALPLKASTDPRCAEIFAQHPFTATHPAPRKGGATTIGFFVSTVMAAPSKVASAAMGVFESRGPPLCSLPGSGELRETEMRCLIFFGIEALAPSATSRKAYAECEGASAVPDSPPLIRKMSLSSFPFHSARTAAESASTAAIESTCDTTFISFTKESSYARCTRPSAPATGRGEIMGSTTNPVKTSAPSAARPTRAPHINIPINTMRAHSITFWLSILPPGTCESPDGFTRHEALSTYLTIVIPERVRHSRTPRGSCVSFTRIAGALKRPHYD